MSENSVALSSIYQGWDVYQQHLIDALAPLSSDQLALRPASHLRSVEVIARHIIGARARWLHYVLGIHDEDIVQLGTWDRHDQPSRSASELVRGLTVSWQALHNALEHWTVADLNETVYDTDDDGKVEAFTRQWVIWHLIEHDLHHGGELSFALGMHNVPAIDL